MPETDLPAPEPERPEAEPASRRISAVWLVPLLALVVALGVAWRTYSDRGPTIEITFENAAGIQPGSTTIRFRDVAVGLVEAVAFSEDLKEVVVTARMDRDVERFIDSEAQFWVVRPNVSAQGVTGIETVISGVYIDAFWDDQPGTPQTRFQGLAEPPLTPANAPGLRIGLRSPDGGSMTVGAPVLFKGIQVGRIEDITLTDAGDVMIDAFVRAPYHQRLTEASRFWNASGFSIELGAGGASLNVASLVSLLQGGVSFDTIGSDTAPVETGHVYDLYPSETAARQNLIADEPGERLRVDVYFEGSVRGLQPGAHVELRGITVGEVTALQAAIVERDGGENVALRATLSLVPGRLGVPPGNDEAGAALDLLANLVAENGLRARLSTSGLLAQTLFVDLAEVPDAAPAELDRDADPYPRIPSVPSEVSGLAASAEGALKRITDLPLEDVVEAAVTLLANVNSLVTDERVRAAPENLGALIAEARAMLEESGIREAPGELRALLASARALVDQAAEAQLVENLSATLVTAREAVASVGTAADGVPELLAEIEALSAKARGLPLDELVASATGVVDGIDALVASQGVQALPGQLDATLTDLRAVVDDLRAGGAVENTAAAIASMRQVADEIAAAKLGNRIDTVVQEALIAAGNVSAASEDLPELLDSLTALSNRANALPLEELVASGTRVLDTADGFLASDGMGEVPPRLAGALEELRAVLAELREGGAVANVNATLASADRAADAITAAAADLPALVAQLNAVAARADAAIGSVSPGSEINRDTLLLLKEVRDAVRSVNALVTALERRPNSVLFGR